MPTAPNSDELTYKTGGTVIEFEERHTIFDQPGKLRIGGFATAAIPGNYSQALAIEEADPSLDINTVMASIRHDNLKYGFYLNGEQQLMKDVGLFARASWNNGQTEILSFTDIDRSLVGRAIDQGQFLGTAERYGPASAVAINGPVGFAPAISSPPAALAS